MVRRKPEISRALSRVSTLVSVDGAENEDECGLDRWHDSKPLVAGDQNLRLPSNQWYARQDSNLRPPA
jgi:hypothetical protein